MAGLDWSRHGEIRDLDVCPADTIPLATAIERLARHAIDVWPDGDDSDLFLSLAGTRPHGGWPPSEIAFDDDDRPIDAIHRMHAAAVVAEAQLLAIPIVSEAAVTRAEWEQIEAKLGDSFEWGVGARRAWSRLAPAFAAAASRGEVATYVRRINGGRSRTFEAKYWAIDFETAVRRAATGTVCMRDEDTPFDPFAKPDHRIFVGQIGLEPALQSIARENAISVLDLGPNGRLPRPIDDAMPQERKLVDRLVQLMSGVDPTQTRKEDLQTTLGSDFGVELEVRAFARIWRKAKERLPSDLAEAYGKTGPRKNAFRP